jgi:cell division transport system permease protein
LPLKTEKLFVINNWAIMIIRLIRFFLTEAFIAFRRSALMIFIAIATVSVSIIVFGIFLLMSENVSNLANFVSSKLEIRDFLKESVTKHERITFQEHLSEFPAVKSIEYVDKKVAWERFQKSYKNLNLDEFVNDNPLPHSIKIFLKDNRQITDVAAKVQGYSKYVDGVIYGGIIAERLETFSKFIRIGGWFLVGFLTLATLLIVVNTMRLTILVRHSEIVIMKLVGATNAFIAGPIIFEGLIVGMIGSLISVLFLRTAYGVFAVKFQEGLPYFPLVFDPATLNKIYYFLAALGPLLGIIGAYISITRSLKTIK